MKRISLFIPKNFLLDLGKLAKKRGTSVSQLIRDAIYAFLKASGTLAILLFVVGCGSGNTQPAQPIDRISSWQEREQDCAKIESECREQIYLFDALNRLMFTFHSMKYLADTDPKWQTSCESTARMIGDCEDMAILAYKAITDSCIPAMFDIDVRIRIINEGAAYNHVIVIVYHGSDTYEVDMFAVS